MKLMRFDKLEEDSQQMILNGESAILRAVALECRFVCSSTENDLSFSFCI